jgi:N-acylneuraminate cytidylyltransferase
MESKDAMIAEGKVLGLIPARGGSKGVPGKNIRLVAGRPLIAWTIAAGQASRYIDRLILSSDDDAIIRTAMEYDCEVPFKRDASLSGDTTPSIDVVLDALARCPGYDWIVLLQPTSPLRNAEDIDQALEHCIELGAPACVSVTEAEQSPYWMYSLQDERLRPLLPATAVTRRQDIPPVYVLNGAVYVARVTWLVQNPGFLAEETVAHLMPTSRSLDIDTEQDIRTFELLIS